MYWLRPSSLFRWRLTRKEMGGDCFRIDPPDPRIDPPDQLQPFPRCSTINGRVTNLAGNGIGNVAVKIERSGDQVDLIYTNAAGNYTSHPLLRDSNAVYAVTPQGNNNSRFAPASRTVALPGLSPVLTSQRYWGKNAPTLTATAKRIFPCSGAGAAFGRTAKVQTCSFAPSGSDKMETF